jgi:hypothetical protein
MDCSARLGLVTSPYELEVREPSYIEVFRTSYKDLSQVYGGVNFNLVIFISEVFGTRLAPLDNSESILLRRRHRIPIPQKLSLAKWARMTDRPEVPRAPINYSARNKEWAAIQILQNQMMKLESGFHMMIDGPHCMLFEGIVLILGLVGYPAISCSKSGRPPNLASAMQRILSYLFVCFVVCFD